jgi:uncharacterized protein (TIGR03546 family)
MFIVRLIRKIFSLLRSDLTGHEIALGFCIGILMGTIPLSSVWASLSVLLLMLVFRASFGSFLFAAVLLKGLSFAVDPLLFKLGGFALEGPLSGLFAILVKTPVLALLDLHRYLVAGGILFSLIASVVCYPLVRYLTSKYRATVLNWVETSPGYARFTRFPLIRFLTWLFMGKKKGDYRETLELKKSPFRNGMLVLMAVFVVAVSLFGYFLGDAVAKAGFESGVSRATDTDVTTRTFGLSLLKGRLDMGDFRVYERESPEGIVGAVKFSGDLSVYELLKRHLIFDEIVIENMDFKVERDESGRLNIDRGRERPPAAEEKGFAGGADKLSDFWQHKEIAKDVLDRVLEYLFRPGEEIDVEQRAKEIREEAEQLKNYAELFADWLLEGDVPMVVINDLWIMGLKLKVADTSFTGITLHATNLSSDPRRFGRDSIIEMGDDNLENPSFHLQFQLNWSNPDSVHKLELVTKEIPSEQVVKHLKTGDDLLFEGGQVAISSETLFRTDRLESANRFQLQGMTVKPGKPGAKVLGLDGELFCRGLTEYLKSAPLITDIMVAGPYGDLEVVVDEKGLLASVQQGIVNTGDRLLQEQFSRQRARADAVVDEHMEEAKDRLKEKVGDELGEQLGKDLEGLLKGKDDEVLDSLGGLFGGKKKDDDEKK